jgi:hypothetical protein
VVRVQLRGESVLHQMEAVQPGLLEAALQAGLRHWDGPEVWIERVLSELTSPLDRAAASERPDALGEVVRLVDRLAGDDTTLRQWALAALESLPALPVDLGDARPDRLTPDQWRALLADAEAMVLAQLGAGLPDSVPVGGVR